MFSVFLEYFSVVKFSSSPCGCLLFGLNHPNDKQPDGLDNYAAEIRLRFFNQSVFGTEQRSFCVEKCKRMYPELFFFWFQIIQTTNSFGTCSTFQQQKVCFSVLLMFSVFFGVVFVVKSFSVFAVSFFGLNHPNNKQLDGLDHFVPEVIPIIL